MNHHAKSNRPHKFTKLSDETGLAANNFSIVNLDF